MKIWLASWLVLLGFIVEACQHEVVKIVEKDPDPAAAQGDIEPENPELITAREQLRVHNPKAVLNSLQKFRPESAIDRAWHRLILGSAWLDMQAVDRGLQLLTANYEELRDARPFPSPDVARVLALSLKGLGVVYRGQGDFYRAYAIHELQWLYLKHYGNAQERHDTLMSLDADAIELRNFYASEARLRESLLVSQRIPAGAQRSRAQILSWQRLAASLQEKLDFTASDEAVRQAQQLSKTYDATYAGAEFRELSSLAQRSELLAAWAAYVNVSSPTQAKERRTEASHIASETLALADLQQLPVEAAIDLRRRLTPLCSPNCQIAPQSRMPTEAIRNLQQRN